MDHIMPIRKLHFSSNNIIDMIVIWTASSEFGTYRLCEQRRFRRACVSAQSCQNLRCSLIQEVSQEEPSDRKPDPWLLWMAGHAQLKFVMTECSKTQIHLTGLKWWPSFCAPLSFLNNGNVNSFLGLWFPTTESKILYRSKLCFFMIIIPLSWYSQILLKGTQCFHFLFYPSACWTYEICPTI